MTHLKSSQYLSKYGSYLWAAVLHLDGHGVRANKTRQLFQDTKFQFQVAIMEAMGCLFFLPAFEWLQHETGCRAIEMPSKVQQWLCLGEYIRVHSEQIFKVGFQIASAFQARDYLQKIIQIFCNTLTNSIHYRFGYWLQPPHCMGRIATEIESARTIKSHIESLQQIGAPLGDWNSFNFISDESVWSEFVEYCCNDNPISEYSNLNEWINTHFKNLIVHNVHCERGFSIIGRAFKEKKQTAS